MIRPLEARDIAEETPPYAETVYQLLAGARDAGSREELEAAVARARGAWKNNSDAGFRSILRATGAFAKDNDGYFFRYGSSSVVEDPEPLPPATHLLVFPVPVETRMRVAYSYAQGLFLKHLYTEHGAIPREVREGWAELVVGDELPDADELWAGFLNSDVAESAITVSANGWISKSGIGSQEVSEDFLSRSYLIGMARAIASKPQNFQAQLYTIPAFRKEVLGGLASRESLAMSGDREVDDFRKQNRHKEWSTLQVYGWLEKKSDEVPKFQELVNKTMREVEADDTGKASLLPAAESLEKLFRAEFVPRSSRADYTELAVPKITQYLLLWALVDRLPEGETGNLSFLGWNVPLLRGLKDDFGTPELRGSLMFMKNTLPKSGTQTLVRLTGFEKLTAEVRTLPKNTGPSISAPFELWTFEEPQLDDLRTESSGKVCTICGKGGNLSTASILPERKKRHYDNPGKNQRADVCARCVQVWSIAPITTADDSYTVVEVPTESFLELFALYESLEGINRLETLKSLNRVASFSVFPTSICS